MDARVLLRRYLEQRRDLGETELVLDALNIEDVMRLLGATGRSEPPVTPRRSVRELAGEPSDDWRTALQEAGVNVDAVIPDHKPLTLTIPRDTTDEMASTTSEILFSKGIVIAPGEAELIPDPIGKLG